MNVLNLRVVEATRRACLAAAREAYEDAGIRGLCHEGRWEAALAALSSVDLAAVESCLASSDADR